MNFSVILLLTNFGVIFMFASNARAIPNLWTRDAFPSMSDRWMKIEDNFKRRADSMREWMKERQKTGIPFFSPLTHLTESIDEKSPQEFDPSVVVIDKGQEEEEIRDPFADFGFGFPFQMGFNRPKLWSFGELFPTQRPWWKGPNVCVERKVIEGKEISNNTKNEGLEIEDDRVSVNLNYHSIGHPIHRSISLQSTHCTESDTSYTCVSKILRGKENKTTIIKHKCCHGFKRNQKSGCTQVDLKDMIQTMKDLKLNRMLRLSERLGFSKKLSEDNVTVFGLTDDSLVEYEDENNKIENEVEPEVMVFSTPVRRRRQIMNSMSDMIAMHFIPGFVRTDDMNDEQLVSTLSPSKELIRFNVYNNPKRVVTANCVPIISANNYANNGMVHIIGRVMQRPDQTIAQILERDPKFSILTNLLKVTQLWDGLKDQSQHMTLFAPTNEAFSRSFDEQYMERLLKGQSCADHLLNNHIMANTLCSSAIQEYASVKNVLNLFVPFKRLNDKLEIDGIPVIETDKMATNGVIHVIDGVMVTMRSQSISSYLSKHRMTEYLDLIQNSTLLNDWENLQNVSFFIPSIDSMRTLSAKNLEEIKNNKNQMFGYHVVRPQTHSSDWNSDQMLETISGKQLRINVFGDLPGFSFRPVTTVQCSKIVEHNDQICGANIHIVDRFLMPSKGSLTQVLETNEKFSIVYQILKNSGIETELMNGTYTLLAPNDQTLLEELSQNQINVLTTTSSESEKFIRNHLFPEVICCSGVNTFPLFLSSQQFRSLDGSLVSVHKSFNGRVWFGNARVSQCDLMADNGVIHVINRVLEKKPSMITGFPFPFEIVI